MLIYVLLSVFFTYQTPSRLVLCLTDSVPKFNIYYFGARITKKHNRNHAGKLFSEGAAKLFPFSCHLLLKLIYFGTLAATDSCLAC